MRYRILELNLTDSIFDRKTSYPGRMFLACFIQEITFVDPYLKPIGRDLRGISSPEFSISEDFG